MNRKLIQLNQKLDEIISFDRRTSLFTDLPDDHVRIGEMAMHPRTGRPEYTQYVREKKITPEQADELVSEDGTKIYNNLSPARARRTKAILAAVAAGGAGVLAGRYIGRK